MALVSMPIVIPLTGLVCGLLNELQVELITESLLLQTLLYSQLHHCHTVIWVHLLKPNTT